MHKVLADKVQEQLDQQIYPGASLALYREGQWQEFYVGWADPDRELATQPGLIYDLASVSKVLGVGTLVLQALKEGILDLEDPIQSQLPDFRHAHLRILDLLTHTSGLDPYIPNRDSLDRAGLTQAMLQLELGPDKRYLYSDVNYILLGFYLEALFGKSLEELITARICGPLNLTHTTYGPCPGAVPTVRGTHTGQVHDPKAQVLGSHTGSAGLFSTIPDLERYLESQLLDPSVYLDQVHGSDPANPRSLAWRREGDWLDHTGYTGTFLLFNRKRQEAAIFLANRTYWQDQRAKWIQDRNELMDLIRQGKF
ncbi:serine hydrolase domain-containing protein [Streptococcus danieliae]|uniref:Serine hydrolase n=1 Tax=Streptococcus danieliae TaxID=747656 RepID=A0A7X3G7Y6_9STRE|nr:serine hydrolase domain-containing protein [Streptococcus danieliae]MCU0081606.1 beta-lactamase family protein [Streptococcus danieliae]MVX58592.1 serine hydrolase [Streptococcus danieliae]